MRVVTAEPVRRSRLPAPTFRDARAARVERLALFATSAVVLFGLWLTYVEQTSEFESLATRAAAERVIDLSTAVRNARDLAPALTMYSNPIERATVANAIVQQLGESGRQGPLTHVGALASVTIPADRVRRDPRLRVLNDRLREREPAAAVPALSATDLIALKPHVVVRSPGDYRSRIVAAVALVIFAFWFAHLVRALFGTTGDPMLLPIVQLLTGLGLMSMIALRDPLRDMVIAVNLSWGIAAGCLLWAAASFIDFEDPRWRRAVLLPLSAAVLLAMALLAFGSGPARSGAKVNLLGMQPVEAIRLLFAFAMAGYFARRWQFLREFSEPVTRTSRVGSLLSAPRWKDVGPPALAVGTLLLFFFLQKDLGPALVLSCVFLGMYGLARGRAALVVAGFAALIAGVAVGHALGFPSTITRRVAIWLDPWTNAVPGGDQIAHAMWAMSSGGVWGLGPGVGDPQLVPAGHTDLILAGIGEDLGFVGVVCIATLFVMLVWRMLRIALRAPGDYTAFLTTAMALGVGVQAIVIVGGIVGLLPLAGVVTPFLSYGRSAMLANFTALGVCAAVARRAGGQRIEFAAPMRTLRWTLAAVTVAIVWRAADLQVVHADAVATKANLTEQADGGYRYQYNPRLVAASRRIVRGTIWDRNGVPLATSSPAQADTAARALAPLNVRVDCPHAADERCYPLGGLAFHVVGDAVRETNWAARNTSFAEKDFDALLKGYDDGPRIVEVHPHQGAPAVFTVSRDYRELLPLVRHKGNPGHRAVRDILERNRDVHLTLDAGLQVRVARVLRAAAVKAGSGRGAAVVLDPITGELLASASTPWPEETNGDADAEPVAMNHLLDRARYGLYAPGSTFKLVTAVAALRADPTEQHSTFMCVRLPDGRVGGRVPHVSKPIRDDPLDTAPHGTVDLHRALVVSCNAYFAQLADRIGPKAIADAAGIAQISVAAPPADKNLRATLPYAGYGQGHVVASPLRMARVAAALANQGILRDVRVQYEPKRKADPGVPWLDPTSAAQMRRYMREVVTSGTGRALAGHPVPIAGKTGTAEVDQAASHSWFVGFAPYSSNQPPRIAFAVIVENAGYGGRVAAPLAGEIVSAAQAEGLIHDNTH